MPLPAPTTTRALIVATLLLLVAVRCAPPDAAPPTPAASTSGAEAPPLTTAAMAAQPAARTLSPDASHGELVRRVRMLLRGGQAGATADCVLRRGPDGIALTAELAPALQNLPDPAPRLTPLMADHRTPIRVLTSWGSFGDGSGVALAAITRLPPRAARLPVSAVVLTEAGIFLRHGERDASPALDGPLPPAGIAERLRALEAAAGEPRALYVAAEAASSTAQLAELLGALPEGHPVALAVVLPPGTQLPEPPAPTGGGPARCPQGLPPLPDGQAAGDMQVAAAREGVAPLREAAAACFTLARGRAVAGGELLVALRIGGDGRVQHGCLQRDTLQDGMLGACVLAAAADLRFQPPSPAGVVDLQLPLALEMPAVAPARALCE